MRVCVRLACVCVCVCVYACGSPAWTGSRSAGPHLQVRTPSVQRLVKDRLEIGPQVRAKCLDYILGHVRAHKPPPTEYLVGASPVFEYSVVGAGRVPGRRKLLVFPQWQMRVGLSSFWSSR